MFCYFLRFLNRAQKKHEYVCVYLPQGQSIILIVIHVLFNRRTKLINKINNILFIKFGFTRY